MSLKFKKKREDFICSRCGNSVSGSGYTNHCPKCLWSRHVDNYPGDRGNNCLGMMEPVNIIFNKGVYILVHRCVSCGEEKKNRMSDADDISTALTVGR